MPFRPKGRGIWRVYVSLPNGRQGVYSSGTTDYQTARQIERMAQTIRGKPQHWDALALLFEGKAGLPEIFNAYAGNRLADFVASQHDPDLQELLKEWPASGKYRQQVERLIDGPFPASHFTRKRISQFLAGLTQPRTVIEKNKRKTIQVPVSGSTKNRYRAALSVFAGWLVEREVIPHNPVSDVRGAKPNAPPLVWLERVQAQALIDGLPMPNRALEALMAATGVEWQVCERARGRDLKDRTLYCGGSKTPWRNRVVRATELWAWNIFADYARDFTPNALLFDLREDSALRTHKRISKSLGLPATTLHGWRHTYAVLSLKAGYSPTVVARQLGHRDAWLVISRYGRFIPDERDYQLHAAPSDSAHAVGRLE